MMIVTLQNDINRNNEQNATHHSPPARTLLEVILIVLSADSFTISSRFRSRNLFCESDPHIPQYRHRVRTRLLNSLDRRLVAVRLNFEDAARFERMRYSISGKDYVGKLLQLSAA